MIFHLAGVVSGEAELDFEKGMRVNLDGSRALFEAVRAAGDGYRPRLVFTSSIAVFGAPFPPAIADDFHLTPLTSYGTQKAIVELLLADYTRRGFLDGVGIRLPSIVVRPGKPNKAASGFFSSIIREPLAGEEAVLPVADSVLHWHASPRAAVGFLVHAAGLDRGKLGPRVNLTMPGVCCTVAEQIAALRRIAGDKVASRIRREPDPLVARIVAGWPSRFDPARALALGFRAEALVRRYHPRPYCGRIGRQDRGLRYSLRMILSENRYPLFGIMRRFACLTGAHAYIAGRNSEPFLASLDHDLCRRGPAPLRKTGQIKLHGPSAFDGMRKAGQLAAECLDMLVGKIKPGVTTDHIDRLVFEFGMDHGAMPATLMYRGYRKATCTSVNHVVCHGIPSDKPLREGDIVNVDVTLILDHWHGDSSRMYRGRRNSAPRRAADRSHL